MANEELDKRVYVRALKENFNFEQITGDDASLNRWIIAPDVNRPGLELSGYLESNDLKRVVVIGTKEYEYMIKLDEYTQKQRFEIITDSYTPCIILSEGCGELRVLEELCRYKNFPLFRYDGKTYQLIVDLVTYLSEELAPVDNLYGVMLNIFGKGVMITGKSGIGKSELALDLISRGHMLVADDRVDVARVHNDIICQAPRLLKRMLEIRGLGIVDVTKLFGANTFLNKCELDFVIKLVKLDEASNKDRLNPVTDTLDVLGLEVPVLTIPVTEGKSLSVIIESAVITHILKKQGYDSNEEFKEKFRQEIKRNGENR